MPWMIPAAIAGSAIVSGIAANSASSSAAEQATAARNNAIQQFISLNVPDPAQQQLELEHYQQTGTLSPQLDQAFQQSQTSMNGIDLDPTSRDAEMSALSKMQGISSANGMDDQGKATTQQAINQTNANAKGQRDAIVQNYAARGMGGSGAQLASELQSQQGDANQAANEGLSASAAAEQRALSALSSGAGLAGSVNTQDYNQAAAKAQAQDAINRFNTQTNQSVENTNTATQNTAQAANLAQQQKTADANVGVDNAEQQYNKNLPQQDYEDSLQKAAGASGQYQAAAAGDTAEGAQQAAMWSGVGSALGQGAAAYGTYQNGQNQTAAYNARTAAMNPTTTPADTSETDDGDEE